MRLVPATAMLLLAACATAAGTDGAMWFSGTVSAVQKDCFFDGVCTATVNGIVVTTMSGERLGNPVWGQPNNLPEAGSKVEVHCFRTGASSCTLKGDAGYFIRPLR